MLTTNGPVRRGVGEYGSRKQQLIAFTLMIAFVVIMQDEILNAFLEGRLPKKDQALET